jgi:hypothetical protein
MSAIPSHYRILGRRIGANFNSTADQSIVIACPKYYIQGIYVTNASLSLTTAAGGFYTSAAKAGTAVVNSAQVYSALTTAASIVGLTIASNTITLTAAQIYFSLTTPQGAAATADIFVLGWNLYE